MRKKNCLVYLRMTRSVLAAAILHGRVLVFFMRSNSSGMNLVWMVTGLMQLARHENFSRQSACNLQFRVRSTVASQCNNAADRSALNWPPWPNCRTPKRARASITWTMLVIIASRTSTLSSGIKRNSQSCTVVPIIIDTDMETEANSQNSKVAIAMINAKEIYPCD